MSYAALALAARAAAACGVLGAKTPICAGWQMRLALSAGGFLNTFEATISADPTDMVRARWFAGASISSGDDVYLAIKSALSLSDTQMSDLMATARSEL